MRRLIANVLVVIVTLVVLVLLWQFRAAIFLFLFSLGVAAALRPVIYAFSNRGLPQPLALGLAYLLVVGLVIGLAMLVSSPLIGDLQNLTNDLMVAYEQMAYVWPRAGTSLQQSIAAQLPNPNELAAALSSESGQKTLLGILGGATGFFAAIGKLGIVLVLSLYWSADHIRFERLLLSFIPVQKRARARDIWRDIEVGVGSYIRSEIVQSVLAGLLLWMGYRAMGLEYPVLLALVGGLAWLVPWLGALLAVIPPFLVGIGVSLPLALLAAGYTLVVLIVLEFVIEPRLFQRQDYSSLLLVLVWTIMAYAFGLVGILLAPALVAAIQIFFRNYLSQEAAPDLAPFEEIAALEDRLETVVSALAEAEAASTPEIHSLLQRLEDLLEQTGSYLRSPESISSSSKK